MTDYNSWIVHQIRRVGSRPGVEPDERAWHQVRLEGGGKAGLMRCRGRGYAKIREGYSEE